MSLVDVRSLKMSMGSSTKLIRFAPAAMSKGALVSRKPCDAFQPRGERENV